MCDSGLSIQVTALHWTPIHHTDLKTLRSRKSWRQRCLLGDIQYWLKWGWQCTLSDSLFLKTFMALYTFEQMKSNKSTCVKNEKKSLRALVAGDYLTRWGYRQWWFLLAHKQYFGALSFDSNYRTLLHLLNNWSRRANTLHPTAQLCYLIRVFSHRAEESSGMHGWDGNH